MNMKEQTGTNNKILELTKQTQKNELQYLANSQNKKLTDSKHKNSTNLIKFFIHAEAYKVQLYLQMNSFFHFNNSTPLWFSFLFNGFS